MPRVEALLRALEALGVQGLDGVGGAPHETPRIVVGSEVGKDVVGGRATVAATRAADADAQAEEVLTAESLGDRAQAVVAGEPSAGARLQASRLEVDLVVHDEDRVRVDLEELRSRADRAPRLVHVRLGLQQRKLVLVEPQLGELTVELRAPRRAVSARELVDDHRADVVPVARVLTSGIAEADHE